MTDSKPFSALSSTMLARKGAARPAATPSFTDSLHGDFDGAGQAFDGEVVPFVRSAGATVNEVRRQQENISGAFADGKARNVRPRRSAFDCGNKAAFTLRLDEDRHLRLRLACTAANRSAQQMVTEALDRLLAELPEINAIAGQLRRKHSN